MCTHADALMVATLAYHFARRPLHDPRFAIGTGKFGELILALTAFLIGYEPLVRLAQSGGHQLQRRQLR
jgi:Co/Zn/Cd efflux system component